jgi:trigger factor
MEEQEMKDNSEQQKQEEQWHHVVTVEELEGLKRKVGITFDAVAVKMAFDKASQEVGKRVVINGFRRGKAPRVLIEKFCAKEIETAASSMLAQEGYLHSVYEHKLTALSEPKVENPQFNVDGTFSCEVFVEVRPSITPTGYIGLHLEKPPVDAAQITANIMKGLREKFAKFEEREKVESGMTVVVDYSISIEGQEIMSHQGVPFAVSEQGQLPIGSVAVVGLGVNDVASTHLTLPADFQNHGGKEADATIIVKRILESVSPTDEELVVRNGLKSVDDLTREIQQQTNIEVGRQSRQFLESQVVDMLLSMHKFEVPEEWVNHELQYLVKQLGITGEMDDSTRTAVRGMSEQNVKRSFMLDAIYDSEPTLRIKIEEVEALLDQEAARQTVPKSQLKRMLVKQGMMNSVVELVKGKKIMDFLISNAEIATKDALLASQNVEIPQTGE